MRYEWSEGAPCEGRTDLFFASDDETQRARVRRERTAKSICAQCHCIDRCREEAIRMKDTGIWGGMTEKERGATPLSSTATGEIRVAPPARRSIEVDTSTWRPVEVRRDLSDQVVRLLISETNKTWHGFQFAVERDGRLVYLADNEPDAWLYFHSLVMA